MLPDSKPTTTADADLTGSETPGRSIAPWAHTLAICVLLVSTALLARTRALASAQSVTHLLRYSSLVNYEWLLLGTVLAGVYRRRTFFVNALGVGARPFFTMAALGLATYCTGVLMIAMLGGLLYFRPLFHKHDSAVVLAMLPHSAVEFAGWVLVSLSAGFCEELIFRGYLLQQLTAWTKRPIAAILLTGMLFGSVHLYQGAGAVVALAALGVLYGFVAHRLDGDLRAVILAHFLQDLLVPLFTLSRPFLERPQPHA